MRTHAAAALVSIAIASSSFAQQSSPLVGTWRIIEFKQSVVGSDEVSRPAGDNLIGYLQYSPGGHVSVFLSRGDLPKPAAFPFTDAERVQIHKGIFGAYAGTYSVEGNKVTHHIVAAWRTDWNGADEVRYFEISGNKLMIKTAPFVSQVTGKQVVATLTFERAE